MQRYLIRRGLIAIPILLGITVLSYLIISLTPGDPVRMLISPGLTQADMEIKRHALGLDQPVPVRYAKWLNELLHGNLGYSFSSGAPVVRRIAERVGPTLTLTVTALLFSYLIAVPVGVLAATRRYTWIDYLATLLAFLGISLPTFFLGLAGIYIFALRLRLLPVGGTMTLGGEGDLVDLLQHLILPGWRAGDGRRGGADAVCSVQHARGAGPGLRAHGAGQRAGRADRRPPSCAAQRAHPDRHAGRAADPGAAGRRGDYGADLRVAGHGQAHDRSHQPAGLPSADGHHPHHGATRGAGQPVRGRGLLGDRSAHQV